MLTLLRLDGLTLIEGPPQSYPKGCLVAVVIATEDRANRLCSLLGVIERHGSGIAISIARSNP